MISFEKLAHGILDLGETLIVFTLRGLVALLIAAYVVIDVPLESLLLLAHAGVLFFPSHDKTTQVICGICGG